ncbi:2-dehydropantoate 2-reductase [Paracidovorax cattleyae]|uniref:2-dehydropantoate 2-reductase n=1 Tax=Paracidovorax cattleyae TaxID=80868 RepID=A0A1H0WAT6_9BURK|nr:2-dehydropantoate 2-reductase [Paracidovorax cattleyae]SDP87860.1 ketopantoate reductase [Paracidovorax cattleyae]
MTRVCIVGAGAIGGFIGTRLAAAGEAQVGALARGATLEALAEHGWRMDTAAGRLQGPIAQVGSDARALGPQDLVVIAVKAPALTQIAEQIGPLIGPETVVLPAMNGVPWWFCEGQPGFDGYRLGSADPSGRIGEAIPFDRVLGCVVHASTSTPEPGLVRHAMGNGLIVGEPRGGGSARTERVVGLLQRAGFDAVASNDVRRDIWYKLWGNMTMNPVSAITGATIDRVLGDPLVRGFCSAAMTEAAEIGRRIGCPIDQGVEDRHAITEKLGAFKTSMLQDVEAGRPLELDTIVGAAFEIGQKLGLPTPHIAALFGLARLFGRGRGLY